MSEIQIFQTLAPSVLENEQYNLAKVLTGLQPDDSETYFFRVDHLGFIAYRHHERIAATTPVPFDSGLEKEAVSRAKEFIAEANKKVAEAKMGRIARVFPRNLQLIQIDQMVKDGLIQYWVCEFQVRVVPSGKDKSVKVLDAQIDILVGTNMEILGFTSNWRPIENVLQRDRLPILFDNKLVLAYQGDDSDNTWIQVKGKKEKLNLSLFYRFDPNDMLIVPWYKLQGDKPSLYGELPAAEITISGYE